MTKADKITRIKANIARQQARHDDALTRYMGSYETSHGNKWLSRDLSACDEIGKAARRLYQLRRELARAEAA